MNIAGYLTARSRAMVAHLDVRMEAIIVGWIVIVCGLGAVKVLTSPASYLGPKVMLVTGMPYLLIAAAPIAGYRLTARSFPHGLLSAQPVIRFCRYGTWDEIDPLSARQSPAFGPAGFLASLLVGLLLNVPLRSLEFILALPAIPPTSPGWAVHLMGAMTADVVVMNFFYMVCFVMALRAVPLFPRMMVFAWIIDVVMQFAIARYMVASPDLPASVSVSLQSLLHGNIEKVFASVFVWLPYLILSDRVNLTFRQRVRAGSEAPAEAAKSPEMEDANA